MNHIYILIKDIHSPCCGTVLKGHLAYKVPHDGYRLNYKKDDGYGHQDIKTLYLSEGEVESSGFFEEIITFDVGDRLSDMEFYLAIGKDGLRYGAVPSDCELTATDLFNQFKEIYDIRHGNSIQ